MSDTIPLKKPTNFIHNKINTDLDSGLHSSIITRFPPHKISKHVVLPPYLTVSGPGHGMLPRVPQNLMLNVVDLTIIEISTY